MEHSDVPPEDQLAQTAEQATTYAHGYASALTTQLHASRTAATHAHFFLPHLQPGMRLLDCGCGSGGITIGLAQAVAPGQVIGIDISATEVQEATARAAELNLSNLHFEVQDIRGLSYPDDSFDAVFAHNVLEHLAEPALALQEIRRVLKSGGLIGIRDIDFGGHIVASADPLIEQFHRVFEQDWQQSGGHPRLGRLLRAYLLRSGFVDIKATASYESFGTAPALRWWSSIITRRFVEPDFVERVTRTGLVTPAMLEQMREAYAAWGEHPESFWGLAHGEAVARKS